MTAQTAVKAKITCETLGIVPILSLPEGVRMLNPDEFGECKTYCLAKDAKYTEKELTRCSQVLQMLGTEYVTARQWDQVTAILPCGLGAQRPVKRIWENRTTKNGLFRIPLEVLPKTLVREVMAKKRDLVKAAADAMKAAKLAAKTAPKTDGAKPTPSKPAPKPTSKPKPKPKSVEKLLGPLDEHDEDEAIAAMLENDGVPVPVEILVAAE